MKVRILVISAMLGTLMLFAGIGTASADRGKGRQYHPKKHPVVIHHVHKNVVHRHPQTAYVYSSPYHHSVYSYRKPVVVKHAPVYAPVHSGWGFSILFGF